MEIKMRKPPYFPRKFLVRTLRRISRPWVYLLPLLVVFACVGGSDEDDLLLPALLLSNAGPPSCENNTVAAAMTITPGTPLEQTIRAGDTCYYKISPSTDSIHRIRTTATGSFDPDLFVGFNDGGAGQLVFDGGLYTAITGWLNASITAGGNEDMNFTYTAAGKTRIIAVYGFSGPGNAVTFTLDVSANLYTPGQACPIKSNSTGPPIFDAGFAQLMFVETPATLSLKSADTSFGDRCNFLFFPKSVPASITASVDVSGTTDQMTMFLYNETSIRTGVSVAGPANTMNHTFATSNWRMLSVLDSSCTTQSDSQCVFDITMN